MWVWFGICYILHDQQLYPCHFIFCVSPSWASYGVCCKDFRLNGWRYKGTVLYICIYIYVCMCTRVCVLHISVLDLLHLHMFMYIYDLTMNIYYMKTEWLLMIYTEEFIIKQEGNVLILVRYVSPCMDIYTISHEAGIKFVNFTSSSLCLFVSLSVSL